MGNLFSRQDANQQAQDKINKLEARIRSLEDLDQNKDGVVSKKELDHWLQRQGDDLQIFKEQLIQMKDREFNGQVLEYERQIESLKNINQQLEQQLTNAHQQNQVRGITPTEVNDQSEQAPSKPELRPFGDVSKAHINETIERLLANENVNIKYLPDFVERQLYRNVFNIALGLLEELINKTNIELLGHEITMSLSPKPVIDEKTEDKVETEKNEE